MMASICLSTQGSETCDSKVPLQQAALGFKQALSTLLAAIAICSQSVYSVFRFILENVGLTTPMKKFQTDKNM